MMNSPFVSTALDLLNKIITSEAIYAAILTSLVGLLGRARLERIPVFGTLIKLIGDSIDAYLAKADAAKVEAADAIADVLVEGQEQLKKIGKVDSATAAAVVTAEVGKLARVSPSIARQVTEAAVSRLPKSTPKSE